MQSCKFCNGFKDKTENMALFHNLFKTTSKFSKIFSAKGYFFFFKKYYRSIYCYMENKTSLKYFLGKAGRYSIPLFE